MDWATIEKLHDAGIQFGSHLDTHTPATNLATEALCRELARSRQSLVEHLGAEERDVLPIMARAISRDEWAEFNEAGHAGIPKGKALLALGAMLYDGDPEFMAVKMREIPAPIRPLVVWFARRTFRRYSARIHGTATP
jgi:hypothetical protein